MSIEQIAIETWSEVSKSTSVGQSIAVTFANAFLSKLAEQDLEPVADVVWYDPTIEPFQKVKPHKIIDGSLSFMDEARIGTKLYTETQLLAAQQRTAEACAKLAIEWGNARKDQYGGNALRNCAEAVRNGDWREYL